MKGICLFQMRTFFLFLIVNSNSIFCPANALSAGLAENNLHLPPCSIPKPQILGGFSPICFSNYGSQYNNQQGDYSVSPDTGHTYTWWVNIGTITSGQGTSGIMVTWDSFGMGRVVVKDSVHATGCTSVSDTFYQVMYSNPRPEVYGPTEVCLWDTATYFTTSAGSPLDWDVFGGGIISGQGTGSVVVRWSFVGPHRPKIWVTDFTNNCPQSSINPPYYVDVYKVPPLPSISGPSAFCSDTPVSAFYSIPRSSGYIIEWDVTGGTILSGQGTNIVKVQWLGSGKIMVSLSYDTAHICPDSKDSISINLYPQVPPEITGPDTVTAGEKYIYFTPGTGAGFNWSVSGGRIIDVQNTSVVCVVWDSVGAGIIVLEDSVFLSGCKNTSSNPVFVLPRPDAAFELSTKGLTVFFEAQNLSAKSYIWDFGDGTSASGRSVTHEYPSMGIYKVVLSVADSNGIDNSMSKTLSLFTEGLRSYFGQKYRLKVYPNPFDELVHIKITLLTSTEVSCQLLDFTGRAVWQSEKFLQNQGNIDFSIIIPGELLNPGVYFMKLKLNEDVLIEKVLKFE